MSGLKWKIRRLGAMTVGEIAHRAQIALRDRFMPPAYASWSPDEAALRLFPSGMSTPKVVLYPQTADLAGTNGEAAKLREGSWSFFGKTVPIDNPPNWRENLLTHQEWPDAAAVDIDYRRIDIAGGAKFAWEHGRLTFLPSLALTGNKQLLEDWLSDFTTRNPLNHGIQHTSGIEDAIRTITTCVALGISGVTPRLHPAMGLAAQQALRLRDHLSLGSSANNHLLAEYAGMTVMGALCPDLSDSADLMMEGAQGLERELLRQIFDDGCSTEQSFGYIPFIWELFLYPFAFAERTGYTISTATKDRLRESLEFARFLRLPDGTLPQVGDEDDGRILLPNEHGTRLDLVGNALATWLVAPGLSANAQSLACLLFGHPSQPMKLGEEGHRTFASGGYDAWRRNGLQVTLDNGPLGSGPLAAHGHADALSVTIFAGGTPIVIDPGSYAYHEDPEGRDRFRSTPYHSTVNFAGKSSSEMLGPFLWGKRAKLTGNTCKWYTGETHSRSVEVSDCVIIKDQVTGASPQIVFVLAPAAEVTIVDERATVTIRDKQAEFVGEGLSTWRIEPGEYSKRIGHKEPTKRLVADFRGPSATTTIKVTKQ